MILTDASGALAAFLPRLVLGKVAQAQVQAAGGPPAPSAETFDGVLLWADVTGFTPLVERLSREGAAGAERLSAALGTHFGRLIDICEAAGGDLLFIAGDGALALWRASADAPLETIAGRAAAAARTLIAELDNGTPQPGVSLRLRVALAAGPLAALTVGNSDSRWLHLVAGAPLADLAAPGKPGTVLLSQAVRDLERATGGRGAPEPPPPAAPPELPPEALLPHLLPSVAARIEAGQSAFLAEFRTMTVVFADLSGLGLSLDLARLQPVVAELQAAAADFGGTVYQLVQDDKGLSAVTVFGLPGTSHEDDPVRAVRFADRLAARLPALCRGVSYGIATGPVFAGPCGLPRRRQYALFGRPMNLASRLMGAARGTVLIDEATHRAVSRRLELADSRQVSLRGMGEALTAYVGDLARAQAPALASLVGRQAERGLLAGKLDDLVARGQGGIVVLQGPAGIGKTALLAEMRRASAARGCPVGWGSADFVEGRTPFFVLRPVLREFLGVSSVPYQVDVEGPVLEALRALGENPELAPLLANVLGYATTETALVRQMTPAIRAENRNRLLLALVAMVARAARRVVVLDDLQWSDAATAALLPQLADIPGILWMFAGRPDGSAAEALDKVGARGSRVALGGLDTDDVAALAAATLGVPSVPPALAALLVARGEGNPLYARELALALRETGRVVVADGRCTLDPAFRPEAARDLPSSLSALIKSRIDRLPPGPQLCLRVASVIGQSFERGVLALLLEGASTAELEENLGALVAAGFLRRESDGGEARFAFSHATVQAVAYELFPERQRAQLHRGTALALEAAYGAQAPSAYGRLSHHWNEAGDAAKATEYSALAARQALDGYANRDAIELGWRALRNQEVWRGARPVDVERAGIFNLLAQAHYSLTEPREARAAFEAALRHVGFANPGGSGGVLLGIVRHLVARALPGPRARALEATGEERERLLATLAILTEWVTLDFWEGRLLEGAAKAFMGYRLAGPVLSTPLGAEAVARLGYVLAVTPFRFLAEGELLRGVELSVRSGDLQAVASSRVLLGMFYTLSGRAAEALRPLEEAQAPAEQLGASLWRHRTRFMLGETLHCLGRYEEARAAYERAAELSIGAEPPVAGMSASMSALAVARLGHLDEALAILEGPKGLPLISGSFLPLQRFASLGVKAEVLVRLGRLGEALAVAREAQALVGTGQDCDVFFAGLHGHAGVAEAYLAAWSRAAAGAPAVGVDLSAPALAREGGRACARLRKFARLYPAARPRADILIGRCLLLEGRPQAALRVLDRALDSARRMNLPYESAAAAELVAEGDALVAGARPEESRS
jgi:class 3 adenylate cyclase/tetratricopeptide (TPR) repeat protein